MNLFQKFLVTLILGCFLLTMGFLVSFASSPLERVLCVFICLLTLVAVTYESRALGCGLYDCQLETNQEVIQKSDKSYACMEASRVNWRRAEILAFIIFMILFLGEPTLVKKHIVMFALIWAILYFYFNFDQFHRSTVACEDSKSVAMTT